MNALFRQQQSEIAVYPVYARKTECDELRCSKLNIAFSEF
jgi:hypothetical protein